MAVCPRPALQMVSIGPSPVARPARTLGGGGRLILLCGLCFVISGKLLKYDMLVYVCVVICCLLVVCWGAAYPSGKHRSDPSAERSRLGGTRKHPGSFFIVPSGTAFSRIPEACAVAPRLQKEDREQKQPAGGCLAPPRLQGGLTFISITYIS